MNDLADLVNVAIEELINANIELPAFSTRDRLVSHERQAVHNELYLKITINLTSNHCQRLDALQLSEKEIEGLAHYYSGCAR